MNEQAWQRARLIPVSGLGGQEERERRATSALLAVLGAVDEFGREMVGRFGAPAGRVSAFCEVPFELADGRKVRVDGLVRVRRGQRDWTLVVEVKTGTNDLTQEQIESYLDVVKERGFDGLLTISNQIVPVEGHHPVKVDGRRFGRIPLHHLSWTRVLTVAHMVREHRGVSDPDQAWILGELIRYLEYEGSGALAFDDMGAAWAQVRNAAGVGTLRLSDTGIDEVAARWDQLMQFLCLGLGARLGQEVRPVLSRKERADLQHRIGALERELVQTGTLTGVIRIPRTVAPIQIEANLRRMVAQASVEVQAPELKQGRARVTWLLRQLRRAPDAVRLTVAFAHTRATSSELLGVVREDPKRLLTQRDRPPRAFVLTLSQSVGAKRKSGKGGFITDMSALLDSFYHDVVQDLQQWTPPAPQLPIPEQPPEKREEDEITPPASVEMGVPQPLQPAPAEPELPPFG